MGNLIEMKHNHVAAALQVLETAGVEAEDFDNLRRYTFFRQRVAGALTEFRRLKELAMGSDEVMARMALEEMNRRNMCEEKLRREICRESPIPSIAIAAMSGLPDYEIYELARLHSSPEVVEAAAGRVSSGQLWELICNEAWFTWRFEIFEKIYTNRTGHPPKIRRPKPMSTNP